LTPSFPDVDAVAADLRMFSPGYMLTPGAGKRNNLGQNIRGENRVEECASLELNFDLFWNFWIFQRGVVKGWQEMVLIWKYKNKSSNSV
jgi:hypothetical protein